MLGSKN
jgi:hypothetical protein